MSNYWGQQVHVETFDQFTDSIISECSQILSFSIHPVSLVCLVNLNPLVN